MPSLQVNERDVELLSLNEKVLKLEALNRKLRDENQHLESRNNIEVKELNHRIKNHLNLLMSTMRLEIDASTNTEVKDCLKVHESRVYTLCTLYDFMSVRESHSMVDTRMILEYYVDVLKEFYLKPYPDIELNWKFTSRKMSVHQMSKLTMIINEAVNNAVKHAFPNNRGSIDIQLVTMGRDQLMLTVTDDGMGCPDYVEHYSSSLGQSLLKAFGSDLGGEFHLECSDTGGTVAKVIFKSKIE